jgi:hypothetical protein
VYDVLVNRFLCAGDLSHEAHDVLVPMGAVKALRFLVDDFDFDISDFSVFAENAFAGCFQLMSTAAECQSKLHVLDCVRVFCVQLEGHVVAFVPSVLELLRAQWEHSAANNDGDEQYNLLRQG